MKRPTFPSADEARRSARSHEIYNLGRAFFLENEARLKQVAKKLRNAMEISHFLLSFELLAAITIGSNVRPGYNNAGKRWKPAPARNPRRRLAK